LGFEPEPTPALAFGRHTVTLIGEDAILLLGKEFEVDQGLVADRGGLRKAAAATAAWDARA
jgi:hypothetical protein